MNGQQRDAVRQFASLTCVPEAVAARFLKNHKWNQQLALEAFFESQPPHIPQSQLSNVDQRALSELFDRYRAAEEDADLDKDTFTISGTELLCEDLALDPSDVATLVLSCYLKCETMCQFKRQGWIDGWSSLHCDSLSKMKEVASTFGDSLKNDENLFKKIYLFTFQFARNEGQKSLQLETAIAYWQLLLQDRFQDLNAWIQFVTEKHGKAISKDTWNLFYDFIQITPIDYQKHDFDGAWPLLIDSFVKYRLESIQ